jgi:parallel beta-helix repeat protein
MYLINASDANGGDCSAIGTWDSGSMTCTLTSDAAYAHDDNPTIKIISDGVTLDCAGHTVSGAFEPSSSSVPGEPAIDLGMWIIGSSAYPVNDVTVENCNVVNGYNGITDFYGNNSKFLDNTITGSQMDASPYFISQNGIYMASTTGTTIKGNTISKTNEGVQVINSANTIVEDNNIYSPALRGLDLQGASSVRNNVVNGTFLFDRPVNPPSTRTIFDCVYDSVVNPPVTSVVVDGNTVSDCGGNGFFLANSGSDFLFSNNVVIDAATPWTLLGDITEENNTATNTVQPNPLVIDNKGGNCAEYGVWSQKSKTCTLTKDVTASWAFGNSPVVTITKDKTTLDCNGHTVDGRFTDTAVSVQASDAEVENCVVERAGNGIFEGPGASGNQFVNNDVSSTTGAGIRSLQSDGTQITGNNVHSNFAAGISGEGSTNVNIKNNTVYGNAGGGIVATNSERTEISMNSIHENSGTAGVFLQSSSSSRVSGNNVYGNGQFGVFGLGGADNRISLNELSDNNAFGIYLQAESNDSASLNYAHDNHAAGIFLTGGNGNTVRGNVLSKNQFGIWSFGESNSVISLNVIRNNTVYGAQLTGAPASNVDFSKNVVCGTSVTDIVQIGPPVPPFYATGDKNKCDTTSGWADDGESSGCTYSC